MGKGLNMKPHKYKDLIIAWANGAEIQVKYDIKDEWINWDDSDSPSWHENFEYRIKPEPKPDYYFYFGYDDSGKNGCLFNDREPSNEWQCRVKITIDGETSEPKKVELI